MGLLLWPIAQYQVKTKKDLLFHLTAGHVSAVSKYDILSRKYTTTTSGGSLVGGGACRLNKIRGPLDSIPTAIDSATSRSKNTPEHKPVLVPGQYSCTKKGSIALLNYLRYFGLIPLLDLVKKGKSNEKLTPYKNNRPVKSPDL